MADQTRQIGFFGGSFDPPTIAHLLIADWVRDSLGLDEIWMMPAWVNPHKQGQPATDPTVRLEMMHVAVGAEPGLIVRDDEIRRGGPSYTVDTIRELKQRHPDHHFSLIMGADSVESFPRWKDATDLAELVRIVALIRPGHDLNNAPRWLRNAITTVEIPPLPVSSTLVRDRVWQGKTVRFLVPDPVLAIIERDSLYREARTS